MKNLCFYHSKDYDGKSSGALMHHFYKQDIKCIGYDYGEEFPWDLIDSDTKVFMIDVSLPAEDMKRLQESVKYFIWIDHHLTAIEAMKDAGLTIAGIQEVGKAGCELTWDWLFVHGYVTSKRPYEVIHLLGRYDVWDHDPENKTKYLQYGMRSKKIDKVDDKDWSCLLSENVTTRNLGLNTLLNIGWTLFIYQQEQYDKEVKYRSHVVEFEGLTFLACNTVHNSLFYDSVFDPEKHDAVMSYSLNSDRTWRVSMYTENTDNINLGKIAKKYGGGGHKGAAGFRCNKLPF